MHKNKNEAVLLEVIQIAIGVKNSFSYYLSEEEWKRLFFLAQSHSVSGICFKGVEIINNHGTLPIDVLMEWIGQTEYIKSVHREHAQQSMDIHALLCMEGIRNCLLKGVGLDVYYGREFCEYRESGDIDLWIEGGLENAITFVGKRHYPKEVNSYHVSLNFFKTTDIELHYYPALLHNRLKNRVLKEWYKNIGEKHFNNSELTNIQFVNASCDFNLVFLLVHMYNHMLGSGIRLKQLLDYYFLLKYINEIESTNRISQIMESIRLINRLGLTQFAEAIMGALHIAFNMKRTFMLWPPNMKLGDELINDILMNNTYKETGSNNSTLNIFHSIPKYFHKMQITLRYSPLDTIWIILDASFKYCYENKKLRKKVQTLYNQLDNGKTEHHQDVF